MEQATTIGLDIAKHVFQVHGADAAGHVLFRKRITRVKLLAFLAEQAPCVVAMEACASAHYWAREIGKLGHHVRLIAPVYVKPFIRRQKNDAADAEAICEAAQRPSMRFVPVKTEEQQANGIVFRARDLLVRQRTQCVNAAPEVAAPLRRFGEPGGGDSATGLCVTILTACGFHLTPIPLFVPASALELPGSAEP
jgi:transposase